ncbi:MAG TPA: methylated-DNA--[protein]-cysteine S-methyltransferase [Micromonosporaceae bacterium]|nr:methylated-DNA--[protein]-cysteine S-methyltransferase [Micromonosporaceae bacterium]
MTTMPTPVGPMTIIGDADGAVLAAGFTTDVGALLALVHPGLRTATEPQRRADLGPASEAVRRYFDGDLTALDGVPVRQHSDGVFLPAAWAALREVKPGEPVTYTDLATRAGRPAAVRAAAQACARNAVMLFVPCHRVVRASGAPGGYRYGTDTKRWLLEHESHKSDVRNVVPRR